VVKTEFIRLELTYELVKQVVESVVQVSKSVFFFFVLYFELVLEHCVVAVFVLG
jgi:hypothetical protein